MDLADDILRQFNQTLEKKFADIEAIIRESYDDSDKVNLDIRFTSWFDNGGAKYQKNKLNHLSNQKRINF